MQARCSHNSWGAERERGVERRLAFFRQRRGTCGGKVLTGRSNLIPEGLTDTLVDTSSQPGSIRQPASAEKGLAGTMMP